jgi:hypothetical protein
MHAGTRNNKIGAGIQNDLPNVQGPKINSEATSRPAAPARFPKTSAAQLFSGLPKASANFLRGLLPAFWKRSNFGPLTRRKAGSRAQHMAVYVSRKGSQLFQDANGERRGLRRLTIGVSEDDLRVIAEHGYEGAASATTISTACSVCAGKW